MRRQTNIFEFSTQKDRLEMAYQLMSTVYENEVIKWSAVQTAVNCQVAANRLVWKVNNSFFDTPPWDEEVRICQKPYAYREPPPNKYIKAIDNGDTMLECPECKCRIQYNAFTYAVGTRGFSFCPYCGTDVRKEDDLCHQKTTY